ncbi:hypothetical protein Slin15195_G080720 [Septoria linicola]|uniref:Uncharacterized protein n=1 Tax=Septoria linicola TaxID=215465 RepID=A0A9Q9EMR9_9PEZI|nr:hypothetical protein Slin15195_G080720 [Septoria linicola]
MHSTPAIVVAIIAYCSNVVLAAPIPQIGGEGQACGAILSDTDNAVGYGVENALDGLAGGVRGKGTKTRRQLAGEGNACYDVLSDFDNATGYFTEDFLDTASGNQPAATGTGNNGQGGTGSGSSAGSAPPPPPPPPPPHKRQLDKISNGIQAVSKALGTGSSTEAVTTAGDNIDGELIDAGTNVGGTIGDGGLRRARRQFNKVADGIQTFAETYGFGSSTEAATDLANTLDGVGTDSVGQAGEGIGQSEENILGDLGTEVGDLDAGGLKKGNVGNVPGDAAPPPPPRT